VSRARLSSQDLQDLSTRAPGWTASEQVLEKTFRFSTYADGVAFVVALSIVAERRDHHPDVFLGYGKVRVAWSTHDAGGTTVLDRELALESDALAARHGGEAA
jgi:4a-hydroxytetrahydrobiopterin dehydratase